MERAASDMNRSSFFLFVWIAAAILLPIARWCGFVHWSWWICAAPFVAMVLAVSVIIIFAGLLGGAIEGVDEGFRQNEQNLQNDSDHSVNSVEEKEAA